MIRERRYRRQLELGIIPAGTALAPRNETVVPWDTLSADERTVSARLQEAFAAMVDHTDHELGRFVDYLKSIDKFDNTIFVVLADNGASQEGGPGGSTNIVAYENGNQPDLAYNLARLEQIGGPRSQTNYPHGWAQVGNTPLRRYKQNTHAGGVRAPLIVSWPAGLAARGEIRSQFHHVIDIVPTLLDLAGASAPAVYNGVAADADPRRQPALLVRRRGRADAAADAVLRDVHAPRDLARRLEGGLVPPPRQHLRPGRLGALQPRRGLLGVQRPRGAAPRAAAGHDRRAGGPRRGRFGVLPLDDRGFPERAVKYQTPGSPRLRSRLVLYPGMSRIPSGAAPLMINRSFRIVARLADTGAAPEGVIVSLGDLSGGFTMYVKDGRAVFEYNHEGTPYRVESARRRRDRGGAHARVRLRADRRLRRHRPAPRRRQVAVGEATIPRSARWFISWSALDVGRDSLSRVSDAYADEFAFTPGALQRVEFELEPQQQPGRPPADGLSEWPTRRSSHRGACTGAAPGADPTLSFWRREPGRAQWLAIALASLAAMFAAWWAATRPDGLVSPLFLPPPIEVWEAFVRLLVAPLPRQHARPAHRREPADRHRRLAARRPRRPAARHRHGLVEEGALDRLSDLPDPAPGAAAGLDSARHPLARHRQFGAHLRRLHRRASCRGS